MRQHMVHGSLSFLGYFISGACIAFLLRHLGMPLSKPTLFYAVVAGISGVFVAVTMNRSTLSRTTK